MLGTGRYGFCRILSVCCADRFVCRGNRRDKVTEIYEFLRYRPVLITFSGRNNFGPG